MSADAALFAAVRAALLADDAIAALVSEVASDWARPLDPPFIRLSIPRSAPWDDDCGEGTEATLRVHVFTKAEGPVECARIAGLVRAALTDPDLAIDGHTLRGITYDRTDYLGDRDDPTLRMGICNFTIIAVAN